MTSQNEPDSDLELLERWQHGDRRAGERLFERHLRAVLAFFRQRVGGDAEDLTQRTFLACQESKLQFRGAASFRTFLFAVAHNVLGKHYRSERRFGAADRPRASCSTRDDREGAGISALHDLSPSTTMVMAVHEEHELLRDALERLPAAYRRVLELYYWERRTSVEIARELGVPQGTARTRIRRARRLLREALDRACPARVVDSSADDGRRSQSHREVAVLPTSR